MTTEDRINAGLKPTLKSIHADINAGNWDALYFATENQINTLIDKRGLDEDFYSRWDAYQEDMRVMQAEFLT